MKKNFTFAKMKGKKNYCIFQEKENFLEKTSKRVAEASRDCIYKHDSIRQLRILGRLSNPDWMNRSQNWSDVDTVSINEEYDSNDEDNYFYEEYNDYDDSDGVEKV